MNRPVSPLTISAEATGSACVITMAGVVDSSTYLHVRDSIVKAALDEPQVVLIDVSRLDVPAPSAWAVFTSARWLVDTWPANPIHLVCEHAAKRRTIAHNGVTRYMRVHATVDEALSALTDTPRIVSRATSQLPSSLASLSAAREFVAQRLAEWSFDEMIAAVTVVVNVFVENVLQHTVSALVLVLETDGKTVTASVQDESSKPAARHEDSVRSGQQISGLAIVASVCRAWGSAPTPSGKTVWAVIGPENRL